MKITIDLSLAESVDLVRELARLKSESPLLEKVALSALSAIETALTGESPITTEEPTE